MDFFRNLKYIFLVVVLAAVVSYNPTESSAVQLTSENFNTSLASNEYVFIMFYAEWCRFSLQLKPIFDEVADKMNKEFNETGRLVMGKVECDQEKSIASRFDIFAYPTLKVILNGKPLKKQYKGQRTVEQIQDYLRQLIRNPIKEINNMTDLEELDSTKRIFFGYFDRDDQPEYTLFRKIADRFKEDCQFFAGFGDIVQNVRPPVPPGIWFRPDVAISNENNETFVGNFNNPYELYDWIQEKCVPLVRELTLDNHDGFIDEGLPFLILFYGPNQEDIIKDFKSLVGSNLSAEKESISFFIADGIPFMKKLNIFLKHPVVLPLIVIDSFKHMYMFPNVTDMYKPGILLQFIKDLQSGKLHRELHYGPDPPQTNYPNENFGKTTPQYETSTSNDLQFETVLPPSTNVSATLQQKIITNFIHFSIAFVIIFICSILILAFVLLDLAKYFHF